MSVYYRFRGFGCTAILVATIWLGAGQKSFAQLGPQIQRPLNTPTISPYLNLFRNNSNRNSVLNYFGLVRPQQQALQQNNALRNDLNTLSNRTEGNEQSNLNRRSSMLGITGHATSFMSIGASGGGGNNSQGGGGNSNGQRGFSGHSANVGAGSNFGGGNGGGGGNGFGGGVSFGGGIR